MRPDPEPHNSVVLQDSDGTIVQRYTCRENWLGGMDLSEAKTGMMRVLFEELVGLSRTLLDLGRQIGKSRAKSAYRLGGHNWSGSRSCV